MINTNGSSENIASAVLDGLKNAISTGTEKGQAATDGVARSKDAVVGFVSDHPFYITLLALGLIAMLTPWALKVFGFGELGPIGVSWAASWQSPYAGHIPEQVLCGYLQRMGMGLNHLYGNPLRYISLL